MKKWRRYWIGIMGAALLCFSGCGSSASSKDQMSSMATGTTEAPAMEAAPMDGGSGEIYKQESAAEEVVVEENGQTTVETARKLIKNVHMTVETEEFDVLLPKVEQRIAALGGYMENMNVYNGSSRYDSNKTADLTIRIPKDRLDGFVTEVAEISNIIRREEGVQDVTMQYVDLESRKKALSIEQDRLLELLGRAETIEDIIILEERLSEVRYELESMESQLRTYDNLIDYSTVYLYISEVKQLTPQKEVTAFERIVTGFGNSVKNLTAFLTDFLIGLIIYLPYIVFLIILVVAIIFLVKILKKRRVNSVLKGAGAGKEVQGQKEADTRIPTGLNKEKDSSPERRFSESNAEIQTGQTESVKENGLQSSETDGQDTDKKSRGGHRGK